MRPGYHSIFLGLLGLLLAGCAGYRPVDHGTPVSVGLAPIVNRSDVPQVMAPLGRNLRMALAGSPAVRLDTPGEASNLLRVTVLERTRDPVARNPDDTGRPLSYFETLLLRVTWEGTAPAPWGTAEARFVEVPTLVYAQPSLVSTEAAALAEWTAAAAREVVALLELPAE